MNLVILESRMMVELSLMRQLIMEQEDIPYKKGQIIGVIRIGEGEYIKRPIVFDSPELLAVILEIKEQAAAYKKEKLGKDEPCECKEPCSNLKRV